MCCFARFVLFRSTVTVSRAQNQITNITSESTHNSQPEGAGWLASASWVRYKGCEVHNHKSFTTAPSGRMNFSVEWWYVFIKYSPPARNANRMRTSREVGLVGLWDESYALSLIDQQLTCCSEEGWSCIYDWGKCLDHTLPTVSTVYFKIKFNIVAVLHRFVLHYLGTNYPCKLKLCPPLNTRKNTIKTFSALSLFTSLLSFTFHSPSQNRWVIAAPKAVGRSRPIIAFGSPYQPNRQIRSIPAIPG